MVLNGNLYGNIEPYATGFLKFLIFTQFTMNNQEIRLGMEVAMVHKVCLSIYKSLCSCVFSFRVIVVYSVFDNWNCVIDHAC